jgi:hypothetical protein
LIIVQTLIPKRLANESCGLVAQTVADVQATPAEKPTMNTNGRPDLVLMVLMG